MTVEIAPLTSSTRTMPMTVMQTPTIVAAVGRMCWETSRFCGTAVPCRIGTKRLVEALDRILAATPRPNDFTLLRELARKMSDTALCNLEARAPNPMLSTLARFPDEYRGHAERGECLAGACRTEAVAALLDPLPDVEPASPASSAETR